MHPAAKAQTEPPNIVGLYHWQTVSAKSYPEIKFLFVIKEKKKMKTPPSPLQTSLRNPAQVELEAK